MEYGKYVSFEVVLPQEVTDETGKETAVLSIVIDEDSGTYKILLDDRPIGSGDVTELERAVSRLYDYLTE